MNQYDIELEKDVLGAIILEPLISCPVASSILKVEVFYKNENKIVYGAIMSLYKQNFSIDVFTVSDELKKQGVTTLENYPTSYYLSTLNNNVRSANSIEEHCRILYQYYLLREVYKLGLEITAKAEYPRTDCFELIGEVEKRLNNLTSIVSNKTKTIKDVHREVVEANYEVLNNSKPTGIYSGIKNLDNQTGGWQNGNLIIVAARPGMGKSAIALQFAKHPAKNMGIAVAMFSLEMNNHETGSRFFSAETGINNTKINHKNLNAGEIISLEKGCDDLINSPIYLDDTANLNITQIRSMARKLYYEKGVRLFIIDYLQLAKGDGKNREQEVADVSRGLKILAKELNIPIIALAQLSRGAESRTDKRPLLSDLRESGAIEQDADIVMFLFRPEVYDLYTDGYEFKGQYLKTQNLLLIDIAKGRGIQTGEVPAKFYGETMVITNYEV